MAQDLDFWIFQLHPYACTASVIFRGQKILFTAESITLGIENHTHTPHPTPLCQACEWVVLEIQDRYRKKIEIQKKEADFRAKNKKIQDFLSPKFSIPFQ